MEMNGAFPRRHYLSRSGINCVCIFDAPDAEAVRSAFRTAKSRSPKAVWAATIYGGPGEKAGLPPELEDPAHSLVVVERSFPEPVVFNDIQAL